MTFREKWVALALIAVGPIALFGPMLAAGKVLYWGTPILQFVPWRVFALRVLQQGHLPFWNPLVGYGAPLFANYQSALLYPPNILLAVVGPAYGHGLLVALHLAWAGAGTVLLARRLGYKLRGQVIAGLAFSLSGYMVARAWFISINNAAAWLPWIVLASERMANTSDDDRRAGGWIDVLNLGMLFGLQWLAGHAQVSWYTLIFSIAWTMWRTIQLRGWNGLVPTGLRLAVAGIIGFSLSALQLLPTLEYLTLSHRAAGLDQEFALTYSFWPWRLAGLLAPDLFGSPAAGTYWGYGNYWEDAIYIGVLPLLLAVGTIGAQIRRRQPQNSLPAFLLAAAIISFVFALGKNTFVFRLLYSYIPTFDLFQAPTRWNLVLIFCLAMLAGYGFDRWQTPAGRALYWTRLGTAGAGIIGAASYLGASMLGDIEPTFVPAFTRAGILLFISGLLTLFLRKDRSWPVVFSVAAFVIADLVSAGSGLNPSIDLSVFQGQSQLMDFHDGSHRVFMPLEIEEQIKFKKTHRFDTFYPGIDWRLVRDWGLPNTAMLDGIPSANNFDPFTPERYEHWMQWLGSLPEERREQLLSWTDVRWVADSVGTEIEQVEYVEIGSASRVWMVPYASEVDDPEQILIRLGDPSFELEKEVLLESRGTQLFEGGGGEAEVISQTDPNRVIVRTSSGSGSWLVLTESWYPGWRVSIDDEAAQSLRANYLFMGVWVPAGEHRVEFSYRPTGILPAALLTGIGWLTAAAFYWKARRR